MGRKQHAKTREQKEKQLGLGTQSSENSGFPGKNKHTWQRHTSWLRVPSRHIKQPAQAPPTLSTPSPGRPLSHRHPQRLRDTLISSRNSVAATKRGVHCTRCTPAGGCVPSTSTSLGGTPARPNLTMLVHHNTFPTRRKHPTTGGCGLAHLGIPAVARGKRRGIPTGSVEASQRL